MESNQEFVVVYFLFPKTKEVYYLKKDRPHMTHLHDKYMGFGGRLESGESITEGILREVKEELDYDINKDKLDYCGIFNDMKRKHKLHIFRISLEDKIFNEGGIENEGIGKYLSYDYHHNFPEEFPENNLLFQDKVIFSDEFFQIEYS